MHDVSAAALGPVSAPAILCRAAVQTFADQESGGIIINVASRAAFRGEDPDYWHYAAAKAGVVALTRTIAKHQTGLGEVAQPQDVANVVAFLASGRAKHATGTTIDINGASYVR